MIIFSFTRRITDLIPDKKWSSPQKYLQHQNQKAIPSALLSKATRQPAKATTTAFSNFLFKGLLYETFLWVCIDNTYAYIYHLRCWGSSIRTSAAPYNSLSCIAAFFQTDISQFLTIPKSQLCTSRASHLQDRDHHESDKGERMMWLGVCELEK